jgi:hypothetical protein
MSGAAQITDEFFAFSISNHTVEPITELALEFIRPLGTTLGSTPSNFDWLVAVIESYDRSDPYSDTLKVDWGATQIQETDTSVRADFAFQDGYYLQPNDELTFRLRWYDFYGLRDYYRSWILTIDPTGLSEISDLHEVDIETDTLETPVPGAFWLFGSSLLAILGNWSRVRPS